MADTGIANFDKWQRPEISAWLGSFGVPIEIIELFFKAGMESGMLLLDETLIPNKKELFCYLNDVNMPETWSDEIWSKLQQIRQQFHDSSFILQRCAWLEIQNSTNAFDCLDRAGKIMISSLSNINTISTSQSITTRPTLPKINESDSDPDLESKVTTVLDLLTSCYPKFRYYIDRSNQLYERPSVESEKEIPEANPDPDWICPFFITRVINTNELAIKSDKITIEALRSPTISLNIGRVMTSMMKNLTSTKVRHVFGAVTCYSHLLFMKGEKSANDGKDLRFTIHEKMLKLNDGAPSALDLLHEIAPIYSPMMIDSSEPSFIFFQRDNGDDIAFWTETIARTGHSIILKAFWKPTNQIVCIKCNQGAKRLFANEIKIHKRLNDALVPNIPRIITTGTIYRAGDNYRAVVTDLVGESVQNVIPLRYNEACHMVSDILEVLTKIHQNNIVHSDVKPGNIIRKWDEALNRYKYYLIDFGFSFELGTMTENDWGTSILYASIEMLRGNIPTIKDDLKMLWYTFMHTLIGHLPWQELGSNRELTLWRKEGWNEDLLELEREPYTRLAKLYNDIELTMHEAWQKFLSDPTF